MIAPTGHAASTRARPRSGRARIDAAPRVHPFHEDTSARLADLARHAAREVAALCGLLVFLISIFLALVAFTPADMAGDRTLMLDGAGARSATIPNEETMP